MVADGTRMAPRGSMTQITGTDARLLLVDRYVPQIALPGLREACFVVLDNKQFLTCYGSSGKHHAYTGGLAVHTAEVVRYAAEMSKMFQTNLDVLLTAAIFHDFMKIRDYNGQDKTSYRFLVRHVAGSHAEFLKAIDGKGIPENVVMKIEHAILAHHGTLEAGSPIEPILLEAYILHTADMLSVKFSTLDFGDNAIL
jgi:3'-5' exoribonuclease